MRRGFTLVEVLVVIAVVALLVGLMLPALSSAREAGRSVVCMSNVRTLGTGWSMYALEHDGYAMPLGDTSAAGGTGTGVGDGVFWWGSDGRASGRVDRERGYLSPYLDAALGERSVYECTAQGAGTYATQTGTGMLTSTYGYNGYYLSPAMTPGWEASIGHRPWRRVHEVVRPARLLVFADTLLPGRTVRNTAFLDPPDLYSNGRWRANRSPTTCFRHGDRVQPAAIGVRADGSVEAHRARSDWVVDREHMVGSVGTENGPWYVPDWEHW